LLRLGFFIFLVGIIGPILLPSLIDTKSQIISIIVGLVFAGIGAYLWKSTPKG